MKPLPLLAALLVAACAAMEQPKERIPTETVAAKSAAAPTRMVVVLPGRGDNLDGLRSTGIAKAIQDGMPDAEVVLVELTMPYYIEGRSVQRLHEEVVVPARKRGIRDIYLVGASMGGMGTLLYEREYPGQMKAIVLMAPYMGDGKIIGEIKAAGGLAQWRPGPVPAKVDGDNVAREEWRLAQSWLANAGRARDVWLICGDQDSFYPAALMIAPLLPAQNTLSRAGGHAWRVWTPAAAEVFKRLGAAKD
jgi:hypothetical protein